MLEIQQTHATYTVQHNTPRSDTLATHLSQVQQIVACHLGFLAKTRQQVLTRRELRDNSTKQTLLSHARTTTTRRGNRRAEWSRFPLTWPWLERAWPRELLGARNAYANTHLPPHSSTRNRTGHILEYSRIFIPTQNAKRRWCCWLSRLTRHAPTAGNA